MGSPSAESLGRLIASVLADRGVYNGSFRSANGQYYGLSSCQGLYGPPQADPAFFIGPVIELDPSTQDAIEEAINQLPTIPDRITPKELSDRIQRLLQELADA